LPPNNNRDAVPFATRLSGAASQVINLVATPAGFEPATLSLEDGFMHISLHCFVVHEFIAIAVLFAPM
jgi:hypothetical protein